MNPTKIAVGMQYLVAYSAMPFIQFFINHTKWAQFNFFKKELFQSSQNKILKIGGGEIKLKIS